VPIDPAKENKKRPHIRYNLPSFCICRKPQMFLGAEVARTVVGAPTSKHSRELVLPLLLAAWSDGLLDTPTISCVFDLASTNHTYFEKIGCIVSICEIVHETTRVTMRNITILDLLVRGALSWVGSETLLWMYTYELSCCFVVYVNPHSKACQIKIPRNGSFEQTMYYRTIFMDPSRSYHCQVDTLAESSRSMKSSGRSIKQRRHRVADCM
jgi:hypothetical protein